MANPDTLALRRDYDALAAEHADTQNTLATVLTEHVPDYVNPAMSTIVSIGATVAAGGIEGALGTKDKIGPVPVNALLGTAISIAGAFVESPDWAEGLQAVGRGFALPPLYNMMASGSRAHFHPELESAMREARANAAADAERGGAPKNPKDAGNGKTK